ncbi:synaptotagmin-like protein 2 isoform X2 [Stegostoma tigrinum]|uniref:synaptotagmin-like protein 2 isoform X2 n=1 Tax=Stegostoma tigrinum TaxID=3053191 RepID=UPI00202ADB13|nr:synaptotagmin-like protein 2 isoform X2 [Stegostoma tigrinum]
MIDLSHLTEEEQAAIMRVLQRDAELRKVEEKRVRLLQESVENEVQRRNMTGEWFYRAKAKRHTDTLHGAELIKASMRKKKPMTIYERLQSKELKENSKSFMNNIEKSVFVSPELSVFLEEPKLEDPHTSPSLHKNNRAPKQQPTPKQSTLSGKQRENPFNRSVLADDITNGEEKSLRLAGTESVSVTPVTENLSQPKDNISRLHTSSKEFLETKKPSFTEDGTYSERHPVPKPRTISYKVQDSTAYSGQHHAAPGLLNRNGFNGNSTTPKKSILKHSPSSSSNDSEILLISVQDSKSKIAACSQTIPEQPAEINAVVDSEELLEPSNLERLKQVRFSTNADEKKILPTPKSYENRSSKIGEGCLLDADYFEETVEGNANGMDSASEEESPHDVSGFSDWNHLSSPLSKDPLNVDQDDNVMSNSSDFQPIPATSSHITNYTNNHLASSGSSKLNNQVREMDTGGVLTENEVGRRLNSASNLAYHSVDKRIPHTDFESPQVSNQQRPKIFQGCSPVVEENDIPQKKMYTSESLDSMIHSSPKTVDVSFQEDNLSSITTYKGSKYNEDLGLDLNKDERGFDLQDQFQTDLNLLSGITKTNTFKENGDSPTKKSMEGFKAGALDNSDQDDSPKNYSRGNNHLHAETWRSSLSEEEEGSTLALKRNSHTNETYKSLQDINVISSSMPNTLDTTSKEMVLSADNVSNIPTTPENTSLQSKRMKRLSKSVPAFPEVSGSTMSIYSSDFGNVDVQGKMQFSLDYVDKLKEFHIFVVRCSGLAAAEKKKNRSDPYVKSYLLPDKIKTGKRKTSVKKKNLNPVYNEILRYKIEKPSLMAQTLNLSVWHNDTFGRNSFLGEVEIELKNWDWSNKKMDWHDLKPRTISVDRTGDRGSLKVAFRYIPHGYKGRKTGEVQIWVKEATNLPQIRPSRLDPFVKCFILPDTSRKSRQKTRVVKNSRNPVFNHTMVYDGFNTEDLKDACVELSVWDRDKLINHFLGGLRIGLGTGKSYGLTVDWMDSTEDEVSVWDRMMTHPNTWVEDLLPLRMLMLSKMSGT